MSEQKYRESVTVLGLGAMGSALARAFLRGGQQVTVWNRTASRMRSLEEAGALGASSAAQAVEASGVVVVNVLDYQASRDLSLAGALSVLGGEETGRLTFEALLREDGTQCRAHPRARGGRRAPAARQPVRRWQFPRLPPGHTVQRNA